MVDSGCDRSRDFDIIPAPRLAIPLTRGMPAAVPGGVFAMGLSQRLRYDDIAGVFRLVHECGECWSDSHAWQSHLLDGMRRLTGLAVGLYAEQHLADDRSSVRFLDFADRGWRDA